MKPIHMRKHLSQATSKLQSGVMLLEALIGILIFSLGILALVGMQATAVRATSDARDRTEASNLTSQLVGQMWLDRANLANYAWDGSGSPPAALAHARGMLAQGADVIDVGGASSRPAGKLYGQGAPAVSPAPSRRPTMELAATAGPMSPQ